MEFKFRNVNSAFYGLVEGLHTGQIPTTATSSRYGPVRVIAEPVTITYLNSRENVLLNPVRDQNCFFTLFESLWMLAGRNDVAPLVYYNSKMADFSDDGKTFNSPYGYRWRMFRVFDETHSFLAQNLHIDQVDQLSIIIDQLRRKPDSRRCVLQIWDVEDDLLNIDATKDNACNTQAYFLINPETRALDITVCNRSNDLVWGCLGANAVQFSFLLEYMAACIGVPVGRYHQITNNLHYYTDNPACPWVPEKWLTAPGWQQPYDYLNHHVPLVENPQRFDEEVKAFIDDIENTWAEPFLRDVAQPMCMAFKKHKERDYANALAWASRIKADDWRTAAQQWLTRRSQMWRNRQVAV